MTGPGNLTASLVEHALELQEQSAELDFAPLPSWDAIAVSTWPLEWAMTTPRRRSSSGVGSIFADVERFAVTGVQAGPDAG